MWGNFVSSKSKTGRHWAAIASSLALTALGPTPASAARYVVITGDLESDSPSILLTQPGGKAKLTFTLIAPVSQDMTFSTLRIAPGGFTSGLFGYEGSKTYLKGFISTGLGGAPIYGTVGASLAPPIDHLSAAVEIVRQGCSTVFCIPTQQTEKLVFKLADANMASLLALAGPEVGFPFTAAQYELRHPFGCEQDCSGQLMFSADIDADTFSGKVSRTTFGGSITSGMFAYEFLDLPDGGGAVPEPSTWAMLILGFGVVGSAARRRQRVTAALKAA